MFTTYRKYVVVEALECKEESLDNGVYLYDCERYRKAKNNN
jgi:hypothetical protein